MGKKLDLFEVGSQIGDWTVLVSLAPEQDAVSGNRLPNRCLCRCACGREKIVTAGSLRAGQSTGCGCVRGRKLAASGIKHNRSNTATYKLWAGIKYRLKSNRAYEGVTMHEPWVRNFEAFESFIESLGPKPTPEHTLDRIDPHGNYEPGNLRWADKQTQSQNRRNSRARTVSQNGTGKLKIAVGNKYNMLTVLDVMVEERFGHNWYRAVVRCDCGTEKTVYQEQLLNGRTKSCGCFKNRNLSRASKALEKPIEFNGESLTLTQWAEKLGCSKNVLWQRINKLGWSLEKALTAPVSEHATQIEAHGETLSISTWAERLGVPPRVIWHRIHNLGWDSERAVSTPARQYTRRAQ